LDFDTVVSGPQAALRAVATNLNRVEPIFGENLPRFRRSVGDLMTVAMNFEIYDQQGKYFLNFQLLAIGLTIG
jgi:hypothetical protein